MPLPSVAVRRAALRAADLRSGSPQRSPRGVTAAWLEAAQQCGHEGFIETKVCQRRGARWSTADAYLRPALKRSNLHLRTGATATRVLIEDGRAVGVEYEADGRRQIVRARREVILSGGANIYPAEVEAALLEHEGVHSCAVIGLPDEDKGNTVHAIIEADAANFDLAELKAFLAERLVVYKLPRTFEFVSEPLRDDAGKVRRSALRAERLAALEQGTFHAR